MQFSATLLALAGFVVPSLANECVPLHEPKAVFWSGLGSVLKDKDQLRADIKAMNLPVGLSQCAGSLSMSFFDALGVIGATSCSDAISKTMPNFAPPFNMDTTLAPQYEALKNDITKFINDYKVSGNTLELINNIQNYMYNLADDQYVDFNVLMRDMIGPCLSQKLIPALFEHMIDNGMGCCAEVSAAFEGETKHALSETYLKAVLFKVFDVLFTEGDNGMSCAYHIAKAIFKDSMENDLKYFLAIPNSQACPAAVGKPFLTHVKATSYQYKPSIGCCAASVDAVVSEAKEYTTVQKYLPKAIFAQDDESCVNALDLQFVNDALALITDPELKKKADAFVDGLCVHLANHFTCDLYPSQCSTLTAVAL